MANWVYPSQQQYYNAMKVSLSSLPRDAHALLSCLSQRKGYNPDERDVEIILAIHNIVNEKGLLSSRSPPLPYPSHTSPSPSLCGGQGGSRSKSGKSLTDGEHSSCCYLTLPPSVSPP